MQPRVMLKEHVSDLSRGGFQAPCLADDVLLDAEGR
jgi:hypothetical protein